MNQVVVAVRSEKVMGFIPQELLGRKALSERTYSSSECIFNLQDHIYLNGTTDHYERYENSNWWHSAGAGYRRCNDLVRRGR